MEALKISTFNEDGLDFCTIALSPNHIAAVKKNDIVLIPMAIDVFSQKLEFHQQKILLKGHHVKISFLLFVEHLNNTFLFSGASDYIIRWNIDDILKCNENGKEIRGHVVISTENIAPSFIAVCPLFKTMCFSVEGQILFHDIATKQFTQKIQLNEVSAIVFLSEYEVIASTFTGYLYVWNVLTGENVWKTNTIHGASLNCLCASNIRAFASGTSNSVVFMYRFCNSLNNYLKYFKLDLDEKLMHIDPNWKQIGSGDESRGNVIAIIYCNNTNNIDLKEIGDTSNLHEEEYLICATERAIFLIDCMNHQVEISKYLDQDIGPPVMSHVHFNQDPLTKKILCVATPMFTSEAIVYLISLPENNSTLSISVIPKVAVCEQSPLRSSVKLKTKTKKSLDQPVTFKRNIKSSGYSSSPRMTMFKPVLSTTNKSLQNLRKKSTQPTHLKSLTWDNAPDWSNQTEIQKSIQLCEKETCVKHISINDKNHYIACTMTDSTVHVSRIPLPSDSSKFKIVTGNNKILQGCDWSNDKDLLLTYSNKGEVKICSPPFTGESLQLSFNVELNKSSKDLTYAQFYYLDKFLLSALGNLVCLHKYHLHEESKDDVKRYLNQSKSKLVGSWPMSSAQNITCLTAPNNLFSYIVVSCGSDRSIEVFDLNICKNIHKYNDVHTKPAYGIQHCSGSSCVSSMSYDTFVTSSPSDGIKLWDLRTQKCSRKYTHHNCVSKCDFSVSPCGKYIASATDNKMICVYDVRKCFPIQNLSVREKVTALKFLPTSNKIIAGTDTSRLVSVCLSNI